MQEGLQAVFLKGNIHVGKLDQTPVEEQKVEILERKGLGHPDTICDSIMSKVSVRLS